MASDSLKAEIVEPAPLKKSVAAIEQEGAQLRLREIADGLFEANLRIMGDAASFRDIDPTRAEPPEEWVRELGLPEAAKRHRIAMASWMPSKDAPVGLANARAIVVGMMKSKAMENASPRTINVVAVQMTEPQLRRALGDEFPVLDVED